MSENNLNKQKLSAHNLQKSYSSRKVVHDISISIKQGEIMGLLGPNGAGKTTCFYMVTGLVQADKGKVLLNDTPITHLPIHKRALLGIGYLPQEPSIFRKLTVSENIMAVLQTKYKKLSTRKEKLEMLLNEFHIQHIANSKGISLSGGERRRVEIARAVASDPLFMLLDEPFAGVDPISVIDIKQMINHLAKRNIGILITDHNVRETLDICERAYIVGEGKIIAEGTADEVISHKKVKDIYLGQDFKL